MKVRNFLLILMSIFYVASYVNSYTNKSISYDLNYNDLSREYEHT